MEKTSFWKVKNSVPGSIRPVYGAQHPPLQKSIPSITTISDESHKSRSSDSFSAFEVSTSDAWDTNDDDFINTANLQISLRDVQSTARAVLEQHSKKANAHRQTNKHNIPQVLTTQNVNKIDDRVTPLPSANSHTSGPGVGVRLNNDWVPPKVTPIRPVRCTPHNQDKAKLAKAQSILNNPNTNLEDLRRLSWNGIPKSVRPIIWKILAGYLPLAAERREPTLKRKREEYFSFVDQYYDTRQQEMYEETFRQIRKDVPRMTCLVHLFKQDIVKQIFERILYIWAIRHPASGYVQGINDLVTPFFVIFLSEYIDNDIEVENCDLKQLSNQTLRIIEADSYWCTCKLLEGIQTNYTFAQPGIQEKVNALRELIKRIDAPLHEHLSVHQVEYLQFAFRWMNNILMREIPLRCVIRLWDTYLSEVDGFATFHLYVCAAFLRRFSKDIQRERDFQGILMMLQNLPTHHWQNSEINELVAEAFELKYMFADAPKHLNPKT